ncbi:hypothetical protein OP500_00350 [Kingella sp. SNUBH-2017]|uniref:hypothetical protein n=1 Tax=Kingella sp. SNUBH-2017 TaxID=2994077 RepID=UPI002363A1EF|nr:hypothetical protein [Kingella sp. SNUBH-2017]MDD2181785.1 hypothetical protein [Kingella sp. SNUBH-2017]
MPQKKQPENRECGFQAASSFRLLRLSGCFVFQAASSFRLLRLSGCFVFQAASSFRLLRCAVRTLRLLQV